MPWIPMMRWSIRAGGAAVLAIVLGGCGSNDPANDRADSTTGLSGTVVIDGSSTVAPLSIVAAELFMEKNPGVNVTVGTSGTGGVREVSAGETDISDASRPIEDDEKAVCEANRITYNEFSVAMTP